MAAFSEGAALLLLSRTLGACRALRATCSDVLADESDSTVLLAEMAAVTAALVHDGDDAHEDEREEIFAALEQLAGHASGRLLVRSFLDALPAAVRPALDRYCHPRTAALWARRPPPRR